MLRESIRGLPGRPKAHPRESGSLRRRWLLVAPLVAAGLMSMAMGWMLRPHGLAVGSYGLLLATVAALAVWRRMDQG